MRIVIAGPPKAGNVWLKCILSNVYDLRQLGPKATPTKANFAAFEAWQRDTNFPDGSIYHQHYDYSPALADAIAAVPAHLVTIIRDPYDAFVSSYYTLQSHLDDDLRKGRRSDAMLGKPLDHPDVLAYLEQGGFRSNMVRARSWLESGRSAIVRYEELHADPIGALQRLTAQIAPADPERLARAIDTCSAANMRKLGGGKSKHVRTAKVGDSKERLNEDHLAIFRTQHADLIRSLGYEVR